MRQTQGTAVTARGTAVTARGTTVTARGTKPVPMRRRGSSRAAHPSNYARLGARRAPRRGGRAHKVPRSWNGHFTFAQDWAPTLARTLLGLVLAWFGYHELTVPRLWTGYVPLLPTTSNLSVVLVLAHGWALLVLAVALVAGVAPRLAASVTSLLLLEIVISLTVSHGLSDLVLRDIGVFGLAVSVISHRGRILVLRSPAQEQTQVRERPREERQASADLLSR